MLRSEFMKDKLPAFSILGNGQFRRVCLYSGLNSSNGSSEGLTAHSPRTVTPSGAGFFIQNFKRLLVGGYCQGLLGQAFVDWWFKQIPALKSA